MKLIAIESFAVGLPDGSSIAPLPGAVFEVPDEIGQNLIDIGYAKPVDEPKKKAK